jgi:hypothetical protein
MYVAMAGDTDHDGILNDAPNEVPDSDHDGDVDEKDLQAIGASSIKAVDFTINRLTASRTLSSKAGRRAFARGAPPSCGRPREVDR